MNYRLIAGLALCFTAVTLAAEPLAGDEAKLPDQPKDYATVVLPKLPPGWQCTYDFETLIISHAEPVTLLNGLSLPGGVRDEKFFKEYGIQIPYLIVLKFVSRLSEQDQIELVTRRKQALDAAIKKGRQQNKKYTGTDVYSQHFVPEYYNFRFSIDLHTSDSWPLELVAPADVVKQRDEIMKLLRANLKKYPTPP